MVTFLLVHFLLLLCLSRVVCFALKYRVYGDPTIIYPKPYSIYLRGIGFGLFFCRVVASACFARWGLVVWLVGSESHGTRPLHQTPKLLDICRTSVPFPCLFCHCAAVPRTTCMSFCSLSLTLSLPPPLFLSLSLLLPPWKQQRAGITQC